MTRCRVLVAVMLGSIGSHSVGGQRRDCKPLPDPKRLPGLDAVTDSAALVTRLAALDSIPGEIIVSVWYAEHPAAYAVDAVLPLSVTHEAVLAAVSAALRPAQKDSPAAFRIRTQLGKTPRVVLERSILCNPTTSDGYAVQSTVLVGRVTGAAPEETPPRNARPVQTGIRVSPTGEVLEASILSGSGIAEVDRALLESLRGQRFRPALLDGRPVEVWLRGNRIELVR